MRINCIYIEIFILLLLSSVLVNLINRFNFKNPFIKKSYLYINRIINLEKRKYIFIIRFIVYLLVFSMIFFISFKVYKLDSSIFRLYKSNEALKSIIALITSLIITVQMFFMSIMIFLSLILKKNVVQAISEISWIEINKEYLIYSRFIRPLLVSIIESILYCLIFNFIIIYIFKFNFIEGILILSIIYGLGKSLLMNKRETKIIMFFYGFWCVFIGNILYGFTGNIIYTILLFMIIINFWVFKK
ncbi:hypothetical protein [Clostridium fallax]|uniref:CAAX protease self-immunity n=1 Tax=Clostridium fallax TaxID=1533 RepID=A0A1M4Y6I6_9CLOT|nr:hypothetical protein [Clostridium fallax]SHF01072.1 hypothetical protein SAMN05443638_12418 [Clostridium fallax]SQB07467.1 Uncharacterised protein [Clostridium fallax]